VLVNIGAAQLVLLILLLLKWCGGIAHPFLSPNSHWDEKWRVSLPGDGIGKLSAAVSVDLSVVQHYPTNILLISAEAIS